MSNVYGIWADVKEGDALVCVGVYSSLEKARAAHKEYKARNEYWYSIITQIEVDRNDFDNLCHCIGNIVVDELA